MRQVRPQEVDRVDKRLESIGIGEVEVKFLIDKEKCLAL